MSSSADPHLAPPSSRGIADLALLCDRDGVVRAVLIDEPHAAREGVAFSSLVVPECVDKAESFLETLRTQHAAFGWEINLAAGASVRAVQLAGSASASQLLIVAGRSSGDLVRLYDELRELDDPRLAEMRSELAARAAPSGPPLLDEAHSDLYDEVTRTNNELANSQRDLARRTADLERANREKQEALEEVMRLKDHLEERVRDRTREYQEANRELEAFSYSVSHDLRAPLRHISGFADLLLRSAQSANNLNDVQRRYIEIIANSTREAGVLIDDLLSFARMGRAEMHLDVMHPTEVVAEIAEEFRAQTDERGITWGIADLPPVHADPSMLRLVWRNLLANAVKYTGPVASPRIEVGYTRDKKETVFFVRDNGVGFEMEYAGKLFGVFQRLHRAEEFPGTGIGLANVRRIVRRHGGRTWAQGAPGKGATFFFSLPLNVVEV